VGSMVYDTEGQVLAKAFPAFSDGESLSEAASILNYATSGLEVATGKASMLDLRFKESRIIVRPVTGANLLLLCTIQANLQFLNISVGMAIPKIEKLVASQPAPPKPVVPTLAAHDMGTATDEEIKGDVKKLKGFEGVFMKMDSWMRKQSGEDE
jgi:hypothetical protein